MVTPTNQAEQKEARVTTGGEASPRGGSSSQPSFSHDVRRGIVTLIDNAEEIQPFLKEPAGLGEVIEDARRFHKEITVILREKALTGTETENEADLRARKKAVAKRSYTLCSQVEELLKQLTYSPDQAVIAEKFCKNIRTSIRHLFELISFYLDLDEEAREAFSKKLYGKWELVKLLTEDMCDMHKSLADKKQIEIKIECSKDLEQFEIGNPLAYRRVIVNLLSNAIEATPKGGSVTIGFKQVKEESSKGAVLQLSVTNTGQSISPETRKRLLSGKPNSPSNNASYTGTGWGLPTTIKLVNDELKGEFDIKGEKDSTTASFTVASDKLRLQQQPAQQYKSSTPTETNALAGVKILIVDDVKVNLKTMSTALERHKATCLQAENGMQAQSFFDDNNKPNIVLMDIHLNDGMDGVQVAQKIRENAPNTLIFSTSNVDESELTQEQKNVFDGFLNRANRKALCDDIIRHWRQRSEVTLAAVATAAAAAVAAPQVEVLPSFNPSPKNGGGANRSSGGLASSANKWFGFQARVDAAERNVPSPVLLPQRHYHQMTPSPLAC